MSSGLRPACVKYGPDMESKIQKASQKLRALSREFADVRTLITEVQLRTMLGQCETETERVLAVANEKWERYLEEMPGAHDEFVKELRALLDRATAYLSTRVPPRT